MKKKYYFNFVMERNKRHYNVTAEVEIKLTEDNVFTASADLKWYNKWFGMAGQILDELNQYIKDKEFKEIHRLWSLYHLNNMHAGTPKQEEALKKANYTAWADNYYKCCDYLESINLLFDNGYKFGTGWLKEEIPAEDLAIIKSLLN